MKKIQYQGNNNVVARAVKMYRVKNDLTQEQLAARLQVMNINLDQRAISRIENNDRMVTDYELACLSLALKTDAKTLLAQFYEDFDKMPPNSSLPIQPEE